MAGPAVPPTTALETKAQLMIICTVADQGLFVSLHVYRTHYANMHDIFSYFCSNIDCVLEQKKKENNVNPCKPQFYNIKVGCKGLYITRTCYHDELAKA